jgi:hypothetical protein
MATRKCGDVAGTISPAKKARTAAPLLDAELEHVLRSGAEAFVCGWSPDHAADEPPLTEAQLMHAVALARSNGSLRALGIDGSECALREAVARAVGELAVAELKFVGLLFASAAARAEFAAAIAANDSLKTLAIFQTNADGEDYVDFNPAHSAFATDVQRRRAERKLPALAIVQAEEAAADGESGAEDDGGEEGSEDEDEEEDDHVECDGRLGPERKACGRRLTGDEVVFSTPFGQDFCAECQAARDGRQARQSTANQRLKEDLIKHRDRLGGGRGRGRGW